jgi:hypothetical protein
MSDITPINANDIVRDSRAVINTNFENLNTDKVETLGDLGITITDTQINALPGQIAAVDTAPTGSIFMYPAAAAPTGFLLCDGSAVSRTTYADLFAVTMAQQHLIFQTYVHASHLDIQSQLRLKCLRSLHVQATSLLLQVLIITLTTNYKQVKLSSTQPLLVQ